MYIKYCLTESIIYLNNRNYITYGISAVEKDSSKLVAEFRDVSLDRLFVENIVELLNRCEVELCHFEEVIIDELNR